MQRQMDTIVADVIIGGRTEQSMLASNETKTSYYSIQIAPDLSMPSYSGSLGVLAVHSVLSERADTKAIAVHLTLRPYRIEPWR